jgi:hypothetical protein
VLVIAAQVGDDSPEDSFKLSKVDLTCNQPPPSCVATTFTLSGSSSTSGTAGNIRTFTVGGVSVKASAFSKKDSDNTWNTAFLGAYSAGLGVTDGSEGSGGSGTHTVDNMGGRDNYVLFEFNQLVTVNKAFLDYVGADSDVSVWIGTKTDPYNNHQTLSTAFLSTLVTEDNLTTSADARWADVNAAALQGNVLVIAAQANDDSPEDSFKLSKVDLVCNQTPPPPPVGNFATFTQGGWGSTPSGNNPGMLLANNFADVYPVGYVKIGGTKYAKFTSATAIQNFLPAGGTASVLTSNLTNPTSTPAGVFGPGAGPASERRLLERQCDADRVGRSEGGEWVSTRRSDGDAGAGQGQCSARRRLAAGWCDLVAAEQPRGRANNNFDNGTGNNGVLVP